MSGITWHADPTVAERAIHGRFEALLIAGWESAERGDDSEWLVYELGAQYPAERGQAGSFEEAREQAEEALRRLNADAAVSPGQEVRPDGTAV